MPLQNWAAGAAPPVLADAPVEGVAVALLLPQALTARANAATNSGSFIKGLDIPLVLLRVPMKPSCGSSLTVLRRAPLHRGRNDLPSAFAPSVSGREPGGRPRRSHKGRRAHALRPTARKQK